MVNKTDLYLEYVVRITAVIINSAYMLAQISSEVGSWYKVLVVEEKTETLLKNQHLSKETLITLTIN